MWCCGINRRRENVTEERTSDGEAASAGSTADAVARRSYGKLIAFLAARTRDVAAAEDALSEAFAAALTDWPIHGCPANPEAWLLTVARRKAIDDARRNYRVDAAPGEMRLLAEGLEEAAAETEIPDRRLALMFACAHPCHRGRHSCAVDAASRTWTGRESNCLRISDVAGCNG
jgi:predicted RNA polymerase sigma factor